MSHFTVLVIGENPEKQLAPFHEFECTGIDDEYVIDVDKTKDFHEEWEINKDNYASQKKFAEEWYGWSAVNCKSEPDLSGDHKYGYVLVNDDGIVEKAIGRTNPNKKWDWHQIGGRWSGMLKMKKGESGNVGGTGLFTSPPAPGWADQARKDQIDFEGMYAEAEKKANKTYDSLESITAGLVPPMSWKKTLEYFGKNRIEDARKYRLSCLWMKEISKHNELSLFFDDEVEYYCVHTGGRNAFVERARCSAFYTFAVIKDGRWYERGQMGWWGMVSDEKDKDDWAEQFMALVADLPGDTLLTIVDCHI